MNDFHDAFSALSEHSRELRLACDSQGAVLYCDQTAQRLLKVGVGRCLFDMVVPGCDDKLRELVASACRGEGGAGEVPFLVDDACVTVSFITRPHAAGAIMLGHMIPPSFANALDRVNVMISEAVELNRTILRQKRELSRRHDELLQVHTELTESHQGMLAMHGELATRAEQTEADHSVKQRMVSNLTHELRTPLHSILGLCELLQGAEEQPFGPEQVKQVGYIQASAGELLTLVDDVLELGRVESGHAKLRLDVFDLNDFVSSTRGMLRPLVSEDGPVKLVIEPAAHSLELETDQGKISQILRNLVANALKFTEEGEVRIRFEHAGGRLRVTVADTGIGVPASEQEAIFEEYRQAPNHLQERVRGTGLGLALSRRLAQRLEGTLAMTSEVGKGSTFTLDVPVRHSEAQEMHAMLERSREQPPGSTSVLVVEDDRHTLFLYEKYLAMAGFHVLPARSVDEANAMMRTHRPGAVVLDIMLEGNASWDFLAQLKQDPDTRDIPVLVVTVTDRADKARALGADEFWLKPVDQQRLLRKLEEVAQRNKTTRVLVIDDDERSRYIVRHHLSGTEYQLLEADAGPAGVALARTAHPSVILLDFLLRDHTAFDVMDDLKADPQTRGIPVIVVTSQVLDAVDRERLLESAEAVISKRNLSRELALNRIRDALGKVSKLRVAERAP